VIPSGTGWRTYCSVWLRVTGVKPAINVVRVSLRMSNYWLVCISMAS